MMITFLSLLLDAPGNAHSKIENSYKDVLNRHNFKCTTRRFNKSKEVSCQAKGYYIPLRRLLSDCSLTILWLGKTLLHKLYTELYAL